MPPRHPFIIVHNPAFPSQFPSESVGMDLRDYFAAKAMQALMTDVKRAGITTTNNIADLAYKQADAMMAERAK